MIRKITLTIKWVIALSLFAIISAAIAVYIFTQKPLSLAFVEPYIQTSLAKSFPGYNISFGNNYIYFKDWKNGFKANAKDVILRDKSGKTLANFPEINVNFSFLKYIFGDSSSSDFEIVNPIIKLNSSSYELENKETTKEQLYKEITDKIIAFTKSSNIYFPSGSVAIRNAQIYINNGTTDLVWTVKTGKLINNSSFTKTAVAIDITLEFSNKVSNFHLEKEISGSDSNLSIEFKNLVTNMLLDLFPQSEFLQKSDLISDGKVTIKIEDEKIKSVNFDIDKLSGSFDLDRYFTKKITLLDSNFKGQIYDDFSLLDIEHSSIILPDAEISLNGKFANKTSVDPNIEPEKSAEFLVKISDMPVNSLSYYWPLNLGPHVRQWVTSNIKGGIVTEAEGKFNLSAEDIKNFATHPFPDSAMDANIHVIGAEVKFAPEFPVMKSVTSKVSFVGAKMSADITEAKILGSNVLEGNINIGNMWHHSPILSIYGNISGKLEDHLAFVKPIKDLHIKAIKDFNILNAKGNVTNSILSLAFPLKAHILPSEIELNVKAKINDLSIAKFYQSANLTKGTAIVELSPELTKIDLESRLNNELVKINYNAPKSGKISFGINGEFGAKKITSLGLDNLPDMQGRIGLNIKCLEYKDYKNCSGNADLTKASFSLDTISLNKPINSKALLKFDVNKYDSGKIEIRNFDSKGSNFDFSGNATKENNQDSFNIINLTKFKYLNNDFSASYTKVNSNIDLTIKGKLLDFSKIELGKLFRENTLGKISKNISLDVKTINMKNNEQFDNFVAKVRCDTVSCRSFEIKSKIHDNSNFTAKLKKLKEREYILFESDNAGAVISAFGVSKNIIGGKLALQIISDNISPNTPSKGIVIINDFKAVKTPLLGKLLTLSTLGGITDLLNNKGISFKSFTAPFSLHKGIITVKNAKSTGSSIGITADGTINLVKSELDLKGVLIPTNVVNRVLGIFTGGMDKGFIATRYSIKGPSDKAQVSVNPLSILTPGFLRNIFDFIPSTDDIEDVFEKKNSKP